MRLEKSKYEIAMANSCMTSGEVLEKSGLPRGTYLNAITGKSVRPATIGKIAKAIGVSAGEIIQSEADRG